MDGEVTGDAGQLVGFVAQASPRPLRAGRGPAVSVTLAVLPGREEGLPADVCPAAVEGGGQRTFLVPAYSQSSSAQNNPLAKGHILG